MSASEKTQVVGACGSSTTEPIYRYRNRRHKRDGEAVEIVEYIGRLGRKLRLRFKDGVEFVDHMARITPLPEECGRRLDQVVGEIGLEATQRLAIRESNARVK